MKLRFVQLLLICLLFFVVLCTDKPEELKFEAPLIENLGKYQQHITTKSIDAQRFFNQGLIMANAFNHTEAARSFKEAVRLDSSCAMAYWGTAYVLGPNYNTAANLGTVEEIRSAIRVAKKLSPQASRWEQELIRAIAVKFPADSAYTNSEGYAQAMREAYTRYPDHDLVATLFAESLMNLHAWDFYTRKGGEPRPWTSEITAVLENAISINPENPLANHLYIHAVEASPDVEKGLPSANRLKTLVPAAGHLVHMPSHIYINTGQYYEGSLANEEAVIADSIYISECQAAGVYPQIYYPHNYHFLAATAALEGRGARAIEASFKMSEIIDKTYLRKPGFETTQHYITIPYNVLVKFAQWEKIISLPAPDHDLYYPRAIWHYARGMAFANTGKVEKAKSELDSLSELARHEQVQNMKIWEINKTSEIVQIASLNLRAEIARRSGDFGLAVQRLKEAIVIEDGLNYNEPPDWFFSVRHALGDLFMKMGDYALAEATYREDLKVFPKNGFALNGLYHALLLSDRTMEAAEVKMDFEKAWQRADSPLTFSRIDERQRIDLPIKLMASTPNNLLVIAGAFCVSKN
jgi:tetratricopeptide (TPR) repeat protein